MPLNISILSETADAITINDAKNIDLDIYNDISWNDFIELFYNRNMFYPNIINSDFSSLLLLKNHTIDDVSFNLLNQVIECYEKQIGIEESCWDPTKKMCLIKNLINLESITDFKGCCFKKSLRLNELRKIIDYEVTTNSIENFIAIIPIRIISSTEEICDIIFNVRFNVVELP